MLIRNTTKSIHFIPDAVRKGGELTGIRLMPGVNEVDADKWEQAKQIKVIGIHLKSGNLEEVATDAPAGKGEEGPAILGLSEKKAKALIAETFDKELLEKWFIAETRGKVATAIEAQLEAISVQVHKDEPKQDDELEHDDA